MARKRTRGCGCCTGPSCNLAVTATQPTLCPSNSYGVWESTYGLYSFVNSHLSIGIVNSLGGSVTNGTSQPAGTYTATVTGPSSACVSVESFTGSGIFLTACINFSPNTLATGITHNCPSDPTHNVPGPAMTSWSVAVLISSAAVNTGAPCGAQPTPTGTGLTSTGQSFSVPGYVLLNSNGTNLNITGTITIPSYTMCCADFPGGPTHNTTMDYTFPFTFNFCDGPHQNFAVGIGCP